MVTINGEKTTADHLTILAYIEQHHFREDRIAVEVNSRIIPRNAYAHTCFNDGDSVEIVQFVGGG